MDEHSHGDSAGRMDEIPRQAVRRRYFSNLGTAVLALWECISGGMDWQDLMGKSNYVASDLGIW